MAEPALLDEHRAYIGASGSGKSTTAREHVEQLLRDRRHVCVTDHTGVWYGLRSNRAGTGAGFDIPIFGGRRGDVPFGAGDGAAIGRIVGDGVSAIVDLSALRSGPEQRQFMRDFIGALRRKPAGHFQLVADEADEDVPEKPRDQAGFELAEDMIWIAKRGRSDGYVLSLITQRPASIAKEALSQAQTIFAHQLTAPTDRDAFGRYIKAHGTKEEFDEIMARLPTLGVGERYVYSPRRHLLELGRTPLPETFDSSRTPGPGEAKREPKLLAELDVSAIAAALQKPKVEAAIAAYEAGVEVGLLLVEKDERIRELENQLERVRREVQAIDALAGYRLECLNKISEIVGEALAVAPGKSTGGRGALPSIPPPPTTGGEETDKGGASRPKSVSSADEPNKLALLLGERMAAIAPAKLTWRQLASMCGYKPDGGYFRAGKRDALERGLLIEEGGFVRAPGEGGKPLTRDEALDLWSRILPKPAPAMMQMLQRASGWVFKGRLAGHLGYSPEGGFFRGGLALLRQNGVTIEQGNDVRLADRIPGEADC